MSNAVIAPTTTGAPSYTVTDSARVHVELDLNFTTGQGTPAEIVLTLPTGGAPAVTVQRGAGAPVTLTAPSGSSSADPARDISWAWAGTTVTVTVTAMQSPYVQETWTAKLSNLPLGATKVTTIPNPGTMVKSIEADPIVVSEPVTPLLSGGAVRWKDGDLITLSGTAARNTVPPSTAAPCAAPSTLVWSQALGDSVPNAPTTSTLTPDAGVTPAVCRVKAQVPISGVNANTTLNYTLAVTIGEFTNSVATAVPVASRPRYTMVALDHSHTMVWNAANKQWDDGVLAAHLWLDLVSAFRYDASAPAQQDRVGVLTFDDPAIGFRNATPSPTIGVKWPAANAMGPVQPVSHATMTSLGLATPASPGQTPLGDGIVAALDKLEATGVCKPDYRYDLLVLSDGNENAGTVIVGTQPASVPGAPAATFDAIRSDGHRAIFNFGANGNIHVYAIALGPSAPPPGAAPVNTAVLDALVAPLAAGDSARYDLQSEAKELFGAAFGEMASQSLNAAQQALFADLPALSLAAGYTAQADPAFAAGKNVYFLVPPGEQKLAVLLVWTGAGNSLELTSRAQGAAGAFAAPGGLVSGVRTAHGVAVVTFPPAGSTATEWRVRRMVGGLAQPVGVDAVFAARDLRTKVEVTFDRPTSYVGDSIVVNARIRSGGRPVLKARVTAELLGPGNVRISPPFIDGTNHLRDDALSGDRKARDGDYANTFRATAPGLHTVRLTVAGKAPDGSSFLDVVTRTRNVAAVVQPDQSRLTLTPLATAPAGMRAVEVRVDAKDARGRQLARGLVRELEFLSTAGSFQGRPTPQPDGTITQVLVYPADQTPQITARMQGRFIAPATVSRAPGGPAAPRQAASTAEPTAPGPVTPAAVITRAAEVARGAINRLLGRDTPPR